MRWYGGKRNYTQVRVLDKTASYTIVTRDIGTRFTNLGATTAITFTLPSAPPKGLMLEFSCKAAQPIIITAGSADGIYKNGLLRGNGASLLLTEIGHSARLVADADGNWEAELNLPRARNRVWHEENWLQRPGINADLIIDPDANDATALALYTQSNRNWEILGLNGTTALCTFRAAGGLTLTTPTGNDDQMIITPHLDSTQTALAVAGIWGSEDELDFQLSMLTAAAIDLTQIFIGFKESNTSVTVTDTDQAFFRFQATVNASWQAVSSNNGTDTETDTGVDVAVSTQYDLRIYVDPAFTPYFFINDILVATNPVLRTGRDFEPYIGVQVTSGGAARAMHVLPGLLLARTTP